jgi:uncharacterized protein YndB with AHSA1/START domain
VRKPSWWGSLASTATAAHNDNGEKMSTTRITLEINAPPERVYHALLDRDLIARWRFPAGMSIAIHEFDAQRGGVFRISLTYDSPNGIGKSAARTDTYHGYFAELVENSRVVEVLEFETIDPAMQGEMRITTTLRPTPTGTELTAVHEGVPGGVTAEDNEAGWRNSLSKLSALCEVEPPRPMC